MWTVIVFARSETRREMPTGAAVTVHADSMIVDVTLQLDAVLKSSTPVLDAPSKVDKARAVCDIFLEVAKRG